MRCPGWWLSSSAEARRCSPADRCADPCDTPRPGTHCRLTLLPCATCAPSTRASLARPALRVRPPEKHQPIHKSPAFIAKTGDSFCFCLKARLGFSKARVSPFFWRNTSLGERESGCSARLRHVFLRFSGEARPWQSKNQAAPPGYGTCFFVSSKKHVPGRAGNTSLAQFSGSRSSLHFWQAKHMFYFLSFSPCLTGKHEWLIAQTSMCAKSLCPARTQTLYMSSTVPPEGMLHTLAQGADVQRNFV